MKLGNNPTTQRSASEYDDSADAYLPPDHEGRRALFVLVASLGGLVAVLFSWLLL